MVSGQVPPYPIRVIGDSHLIIRFLLGIYKKTSKAEIYEALRKGREALRECDVPVSYRHVPRRWNGVADHMCRVALEHHKTVTHREMESLVPEQSETEA